jgi:hypothetical protein
MKRRLFVMFALAALAGCGENSSTGPDTVNLVGSWTLQSVNGGAIPFTQTSATEKREVLSGSLVISANGAFTSTLIQRVTPTGATTGNIVVLTTFGTVDVNGGVVVLRRTDIANDPGTTAELTSTTLAYTLNGLALGFRSA